MGVRPAHEGDRDGTGAQRKGFGDGLSQAFEMIATPGVFALLGYAADTRLGTTPLCTVLFGTIVLVYTVWKFLHAYTVEMAALEASATWSRRPAPTQPLQQVHSDG